MRIKRPRAMGAPAGWPYSEWLDLEVIAAGEEPIAIIAKLHNEPFAFMREFLAGQTSPPGYRRIDIGHSGFSHMAACSRRKRPPTGYAIAFDAATHLQLLMTIQRLLAVPSLL